MARLVDRLAVWTALAGGGVLLLLVVMTCISIAGRALVWAGLRPIPGDFELVEFGVGFAVFAGLPLCHLRRGHASVELFARWFGRAGNRILDLVTDLIVLGVAGLITWRLALGMLDKRQYQETTFILQIEVWQGYALALAASLVFCLAAACRAWETAARFWSGAGE